MHMATFSRSVVVFALLLTCSVCAAGPSASETGATAPGTASSSARLDHRESSTVQRAIAYEGEDPGAIQLTAGSGPVDSMTSSLKSGVNKVETMFSPEPASKQAPNPISLDTKSKVTPELCVAIARLNEARGNWEEAEQQYQKALKLASTCLEAQVGMGRLRDREGKTEEALQWYQKALKAHPKEASVYNDLGLCSARQHLYAKSREALQRAVELQPTKPLYRNNLAMVLVEMGDNDKAFAQLVAVHGEAAACYNLGYLVYKKGQYDLAARLFTKAAERDPSMTDAQIWAQQAQASLAGQQASPTKVVTTPPAATSRPAATGTSPSPSSTFFQARRPEPVARPSRQLPPVSQPSASQPAPLPPTGAADSAGRKARPAEDAAAPQAAPLPPELQAEPQLLPPVAR